MGGSQRSSDRALMGSSGWLSPGVFFFRMLTDRDKLYLLDSSLVWTPGPPARWKLQLNSTNSGGRTIDQLTNLFRNKVFHTSAVVPALEFFVKEKGNACSGKPENVVSVVDTFLSQGRAGTVAQILERYVSVVLTLTTYGNFAEWQLCFKAALESFHKVLVRWRSHNFEAVFPTFWWKQVFEVERTFKPMDVKMIFMGVDPVALDRAGGVRYRATGIAFNLHELTSGNTSLDGMKNELVYLPCAVRPCNAAPSRSVPRF